MRGIAIAGFLLCFAAISGFMAVSGINDIVGYSPDTGVQSQSEQVQSELGGDQRPSDRGGGGGLLGFAVFAADQLANLFSLYGTIEVALETFGFPPYLAAQAQGIAIIIGVFMLVMVLRGVVW